MKLKIYQVDAFTDELFKGNPAAVVPLTKWIDESLMQKIAMENNLSETAFFVKTKNYFQIRWFTPTTEVDLCGHATLASAFVIFNFIQKDKREITFESKSGKLVVTKSKDLLSLNFPASPSKPISLDKNIADCFDIKPLECLTSTFDLIVFESEDFIKNYVPRIEELKKLHQHGVIITAKSSKVDFVSRVFVPNEGINEDPVTGSAHAVLVPYWSEKLNKQNLVAHQVSTRSGKLWLKNLGERVQISGKASLYLTGVLSV